jgi:hypothetical protein
MRRGEDEPLGAGAWGQIKRNVVEADFPAPPANERSLPLKEFRPVGNAIMPPEDNRCESENDWRKDHILFYWQRRQGDELN